MKRESYSSPDAAIFPIVAGGLICQSDYLAPDVEYGDVGGAGLEILDSDINYGGSF